MIFDAQFDAQQISLDEIFVQLKELLASKLGKSVSIEIRVYSRSDAAKVKAFVTMSGCRTTFDKNEECYILHVTGSPCCV